MDVHYIDGGARAAGVGFAAWDAEQPVGTWVVTIPEVDGYVPGDFYRRELPCLLALLEVVDRRVSTLIVDGNAWNAPARPGLGAHLWEALRQRVPVVGVAKTALRGVVAEEVLRGTSRKPLFVTAAGLDDAVAAAHVASMAGAHRIPALLKAVDRLARQS